MPKNEGTEGNGTFSFTAGKVSLQIASGNLLTILIVLGLLGLLVASTYTLNSFVKNVHAEHQMLRDEHRAFYEKLREGLEELIYFMSLPEKAQRPVLTMPKSLRQRLSGADAVMENF